MQRDYDVASRQRLKRALLDKLAERYDFPVPPGMVEMEFDSIWAQHEAEQEAPDEWPPRAAEGGRRRPATTAALIAPEETALEGARTAPRRGGQSRRARPMRRAPRDPASGSARAGRCAR